MTEIATPVEQPTTKEIARHYSAAMDSVNLINGGKPEGMDDADWADWLLVTKSTLNLWLQNLYGQQKI